MIAKLCNTYLVKYAMDDDNINDSISCISTYYISYVTIDNILDIYDIF